MSIEGISRGVKQKIIAEQFGVTFQTISKIKTGLTWRHVKGGA
jgi:transcriptional regulator with XRE-family HTH domain